MVKIPKASEHRCPSCNRILAPQAVLCVDCGFDLRTGSKRTTKRGDASIDSCNIRRDGKWLVVPIDGAVFPNRCVQTNMPVDTPDFPFEARLTWQQARIANPGEQAAEMAAAAFFGLLSGALDVTGRRKLVFDMGLADKLQSRYRWQRRIGLALVIAGPFLGGLLGATAAVASTKMYGSPSLAWLIAGASPGPILMIVGYILCMWSISQLRVVHSNGRFVWLEGAHPAFVAALAESKHKRTPPSGRLLGFNQK